MKEYFSIDDLSTMTMLSTRTLRNYINQSLLTGEKIHGAWRFSPEDVETFLNQNFVKQALLSKKNSIVFNYMSEYKNEDSACSIQDYTNIEKENAKEIRDKILKLVNSNQYGEITFSYSFNEKKKTARIILTGAMSDVNALMTDYNNSI